MKVSILCVHTTVSVKVSLLHCHTDMLSATYFIIRDLSCTNFQQFESVTQQGAYCIHTSVNARELRFISIMILFSSPAVAQDMLSEVEGYSDTFEGMYKYVMLMFI